MNDLNPEYFRTLAEQLSFISVFLGGISATILGTFVIHDNNSKIFKWMISFISLASISFIIAVIAMNKVQIVLTPNSPYQNHSEFLFFPRLTGGIAFYVGIYSLLVVISLSGWLKSKKIGLFTSIIGFISGILIFTMT